MAIALMPPTDNKEFDLDNMMGESAKGGSTQRFMYTNDNYVRHVREILPWMHDRGYFEN